MNLDDLKDINLDSLPFDIKQEIIELLELRERAIKYNAVDQFTPYEFQKRFYDASKEFRFRFLCAANRVGKSFSEAAEFSYHATGLYPDWWEGHRFDKPILAWAVGITGESTRNVLQKELFGTSAGKDEQALGTGTIPQDCINFDTIVRDGNRIIECQIKHYDKNGEFDGHTILQFKSTQQGEHVLMGATVDYIWLDEEDPFKSIEIYSQCVTRTATTGGLVTITATPENGLTKLVDLFMKNKDGMLYFQNATWDDAPHLSEEDKKKLLASIPEWQHEMRTRGIPTMGEGLIYDVAESGIICDPIQIPNHWRRCAAVDIGINHPTAVAWTAYDAASDTIYVYDVYREKGGVPSQHGTAINARGNWIPVILPHDADNTEKGSGKSVAQYYREAGVNVMPETFYNPISWDGKKHNFVEPGIMNILQRMKTGRFKVFSTCGAFFEELRRYHRKDGRIVKEFDDVMDAVRYSALSVDHRGVSEGEAHAGFNSAYKDQWNMVY